MERRAAFLARACPDPHVRARLTAQLRCADDAESYFDHAIQGVAASLRTGQEPAPGDVIGSYRIVSLIGSGGMGNVFLAERADGEIHQKVAIKFLRADRHRAVWRERFLKERQLLASLHHPSVVYVIDAGHTADARPFLVMEYVEGVPIDRYAAGIKVRDRLKLFLRVCEGVSHAHRHSIIHCDLKPSNILVDAMGQPKLLDFGIAKLVNETRDATQPVEQLLTPDYASPEQVRGEAQSTATDVFSLGAVLHKLLTETAPREQALDIGKGGMAPPSLGPEIPKDLDFVVRKALRPKAEERYVSVDEFASDVRAVLDRRPVQARGGDAWYRTQKHLRRHWIPLAAALLGLASLSAGLWVANRERSTAPEALDAGKGPTDRTTVAGRLGHVPDFLWITADVHRRQGDLDQALKELDDAVGLSAPRGAFVWRKINSSPGLICRGDLPGEDNAPGPARPEHVAVDIQHRVAEIQNHSGFRARQRIDGAFERLRALADYEVGTGNLPGAVEIYQKLLDQARPAKTQSGDQHDRCDPPV